MLEALKTLISASEYTREELESIVDKHGSDWLVSRIPLPIGVLLCAYDEFEEVADELSQLREAAAVLTKCTLTKSNTKVAKMDDKELQEMLTGLHPHRSSKHYTATVDLLARIPQLLEAEATLNALYAGGVDNWEGYSLSLDMME